MSRKLFYPTPTLPLLRGGSKKFTNDLGLLYKLVRHQERTKIAKFCCDRVQQLTKEQFSCVEA